MSEEFFSSSFLSSLVRINYFHFWQKIIKTAAEAFLITNGSGVNWSNLKLIDMFPKLIEFKLIQSKLKAKRSNEACLLNKLITWPVGRDLKKLLSNCHIGQMRQLIYFATVMYKIHNKMILQLHFSKVFS